MSDLENVKLTGESKNILKENILYLQEIFPEVFTEDKIDFEKLKVVLGENLDASHEKYSFTWPGKTQAIKESQKQSTGTLRPSHEDSKYWDGTQNLYIEGGQFRSFETTPKRIL